MGSENALILRAKNSIVAQRLKNLISLEACKGCTPIISPHPVHLEPRFVPISDLNRNPDEQHADHWLPDYGFNRDDWLRFIILTSEDQKISWHSIERFVKQLTNLSHRIGFEIVGNQTGITTSFLVHRQDFSIVSVIFKSEFEVCKLVPIDEDFFPYPMEKPWRNLAFRDYFPLPPYSELVTGPAELKKSPLKSVVMALAQLEPQTIGFYQVISRAADPEHDWHRNVEILKDLQFNAKLQGSGAPARGYQQQSPSGDLKMMAWEIENKAHNDKPFFCMALRIGIIDPECANIENIDTLTAATAFFQHGGRQLRFISDEDYYSRLHLKDIQNILRYGRTHRPGFLINSLEHTGFINLFFFPKEELKVF